MSTEETELPTDFDYGTYLVVGKEVTHPCNGLCTVPKVCENGVTCGPKKAGSSTSDEV